MKMQLKSRFMMIVMLASSLFATNVFADATGIAGASSAADSVAVSLSGGGGGGQGGQGGNAGASAGVNQLNALSNQAGATGNTTTTSLNFAGTTIPANTKADNTIHQEVSGTQTIKNVPSMGASGLTTTLTETCMGSSSAGGAVPGFGLTFGSTWKDEECVNRLNAREVRTLGPDGALAAKEIMCSNEVVRLAYRRIKKPCIGDDEVIASNAPEKKSSWFSPSGSKAPPVKRNELVPHQWFEDL